MCSSKDRPQTNQTKWKEPDKKDYTVHNLIYEIYRKGNMIFLEKPRQLVKRYFWVLEKCFWKWKNICIGELSKADCPLQCRRASSNPSRAQIEQKGRGRAKLLPCLSWDIHLLLPVDTDTPSSQAFRHWHSQFSDQVSLHQPPIPRPCDPYCHTTGFSPIGCRQWIVRLLDHKKNLVA